jgi:hypothetical protein
MQHTVGRADEGFEFSRTVWPVNALLAIVSLRAFDLRSLVKGRVSLELTLDSKSGTTTIAGVYKQREPGLPAEAYRYWAA